MKIYHIIFLIIITLSSSASAAIYKWVDDKGVTHFGTHMPPNEKEKLQIEQMNLLTGDSFLTQKPDNNKTLSALQHKPLNSTALNCAASFKHISSSISDSLYSLNKNLELGHIQQTDFDKSSTLFKSIKNKVSIAACEKATGSKQRFYSCMSTRDDDLIGCLKKAQS